MHALKHHLYIQLTWPIGLIIFVCIFVILIERNVYIRESTFITPRGGDEDVLKKAHIFTGPLLRLLVNFRCPPSKFLKFSMPPPPPPHPPEFGIDGVQSGILSDHRYNLQFLKLSDILKHVLLLNKIPTCCFFHLTSAR